MNQSMNELKNQSTFLATKKEREVIRSSTTRNAQAGSGSKWEDDLTRQQAAGCYEG
jgi:hypothetical protein